MSTRDGWRKAAPFVNSFCFALELNLAFCIHLNLKQIGLNQGTLASDLVVIQIKCIALVRSAGRLPQKEVEKGQIVKTAKFRWMKNSPDQGYNLKVNRKAKTSPEAFPITWVLEKVGVNTASTSLIGHRWLIVPSWPVNVPILTASKLNRSCTSAMDYPRIGKGQGSPWHFESSRVRL